MLLLTYPVEFRPELGVVIRKFAITAELHVKLHWRYMLPKILVELKLFAGLQKMSAYRRKHGVKGEAYKRINEWIKELKETPHKPGNCEKSLADIATRVGKDVRLIHRALPNLSG